MIEKNIFGMIFVIVGLVILISLLVSWNNDMDLVAQKRVFDDLSDNLKYLCSSSDEQINIYHEIEYIGDKYVLKIPDNNSLCLISSEDEYFCERFACREIYSSGEVVINNSQDEMHGYRCSLDMRNSVLNISCQEMYG